MSEPSPKAVNQLLAALPDAEYQRLVPHLEYVPLPLQQVLHKRGESIEYVYFPHRAIVSLIASPEEGLNVEVGLVGNEGMVGIPAVLGDNIASTTAMVQREDSGMRMEASLLKTEFQQGGSLQNLLLRYTQALYAQTSQTAACNRLHQLDERLARWLLLFCDRIESNELWLTQEFISKMLAVRRAGVTEAANRLQQAGLIRYNRGRITILSRQELEAASCPCYKIIKGEYARLLGTGND
ncbi:Crp/Fnr family transcriptional regulator [Microcoleus sp. FACHB-SPT15]|uniref:Crp/Fnr family transcriptional regulator n=1 Tax=Microcoleus sp. FACHB-SPT15 TaxID=2692830 RepID=UPI0017855F44|nr:Crp/Fnr family transcriptional regulator [Microcoleus sp. FACHB-SPT15]MBD1804619.1 Crp/Fnr family transcriptional regulator [Microcoleus sp. FACHB-SPT15]